MQTCYNKIYIKNVQLINLGYTHESKQNYGLTNALFYLWRNFVFQKIYKYNMSSLVVSFGDFYVLFKYYKFVKPMNKHVV